MAAIAGAPSPPRRKRPRAQVRPQVRSRAQAQVRPQVRPRAQVRRGEGPHLSQLPPEIVLRIFQAAVESEGAVPFLCRASRVCRLWRDLAADPRLWLRVHLGGHLGGHLRGHPKGHLGGPARGRRIPEQVLGHLLRLAETRFSHLQEFVLSDWSNHVGHLLQALSKFCPHLTHLELRHCQVEPAALGRFLAAPPPLQHLHLTCPHLRPVLPALAAGQCPRLRVLELEQNSGDPEPALPLPLEQLQAACPLLQVLRLRGVLWVLPRPPRPTAPPPAGFPRLRELGLGAPGLGGDGLLLRLLSHAPHLRALELHGAPQVSPQGLLELPCAGLERLLAPLSPRCPPVSPWRGPVSWAAVTLRWHRTLLELDLSGRRDPDLGRALAAFGARDPLRVLRVAGTPVSAPELRPLLACPHLSHLDLSSCRRLPRGTKRPHLGRGAVLEVLRGLGGDGDTQGSPPGMGTPPGDSRDEEEPPDPEPSPPKRRPPP